MLRDWAVLLFIMSVLPPGQTAHIEKTGQYTNLDLALVKPTSKEHKSWRAVHHWKSNLPSSLTDITLAININWASGLMIVQAADLDATSIEVIVNHFTETEVDIKDDFFQIEVGPDVDLHTCVNLRDPYEGPSHKVWIEMVLRLPRGRHYATVATSTHSDTAEWTHRVENLDQFGITMDNLSLHASKGSAYIDKTTSNELNVELDAGDVTIASSVKTDPGSLWIVTCRGQIHIVPREDGDVDFLVKELFFPEEFSPSEIIGWRSFLKNSLLYLIPSVLR